MKLANNFTIGSDPEFVFVRRRDSAKMPAVDLGLKPGVVGGADNNLRLAELRPGYSYSVIEHVAGILVALRWLCASCPESLAYDWRAGAFYAGDAIGGHIHLGRGDAYRAADIEKLSGISVVLEALPLCVASETEFRRQGDAYSGKAYGKLGDVRAQPHGFEYRSLPSWLGSPCQAFLVLTAAKLALISSLDVGSWKSCQWTRESAIEAIRSLCAEFRTDDEDASVLFDLVNRRVNFVCDWLENMLDFKKVWGLHQYTQPFSTVRINRLPRSLWPTTSEIEEIRLHLAEDKALGFMPLNQAFKLSLPAGYVWSLSDVQLSSGSFVGEILHDVVNHKLARIRFVVGKKFFVSRDLVAHWNDRHWARAHEIFPGHLSVKQCPSRTISFDRKMHTYQDIAQIRELLFAADLFPIWHYDEVVPEAYSEWMKGIESEKLTAKTYDGTQESL